MEELNIQSKFMRLRHIFKSQRVYLNLLLSLLVRRTTTMKVRPLVEYRVARHGPAVTVTPVLTP